MAAMIKQNQSFARFVRLVMAPTAIAVFITAAATSAFGQTEEPATTSQSTESAVAAEQPVPQGQEATAEADLPESEVSTLLGGDEIDALTSRIALYPDPLLELTLQAAIFPLDVVQASRFLAKHAEDPSLQPDPEWDQSVLGLLNYPVVIEAMNDDLDWTEKLGLAVVNQLQDVQDSIQQFRAQLYAGGALVTDGKQRVIVGEDVIAILPANPDLIYVPQYDVMAFAPPVEEAAGEPAEPELAAEEATEAAMEPSAGTAAEPEMETAESMEPAPTEYAAAAPGTEAAPVYSEAPVYASAPPVAYSDPYPSFWSTAATFLGGAAVGGLIGYAIGDDDDDDDNNNNGGNDWSRNVNIEDSNIIINKDDDRLDGRSPRRDGLNKRDAQAELRQRQRQRGGQDLRGGAQRQQTAQNVRRDAKPKGTAPVRMARADKPQTKAVAQQRQTTGKQAAAKRTKRLGEASTKKSAATALSGSKNTSGKQVKAQSRRGSESRAVAKRKAEPQKVAARKGGQGLTKPKNGTQVKKQANRGKKSGGGKKRKRA
ncbi:MAG TPA: DUF3300 domain-containing protein [Alphaproteobacteria bacterium]|nr:DUF3300 domain-containing protein [Alphaproteobacteria bacterium]